MKFMIIVALALMLLAIGAAVALMPNKDTIEPGRYTSEAYIMAVDRENINICERWQSIDWNKVRIFDLDGQQIPWERLSVPCQAILVIQEQGDRAEIREIHTQITYRVNEYGRTVVDRQVSIW